MHSPRRTATHTIIMPSIKKQKRNITSSWNRPNTWGIRVHCEGDERKVLNCVPWRIPWPGFSANEMSLEIKLQALSLSLWGRTYIFLPEIHCELNPIEIVSLHFIDYGSDQSPVLGWGKISLLSSPKTKNSKTPSSIWRTWCLSWSELSCRWQRWCIFTPSWILKPGSKFWLSKKVVTYICFSTYFLLPEFKSEAC